MKFSDALEGNGTIDMTGEGEMARVTGLEPATSGVTGRHSNRLSYTRALKTLRSPRMWTAVTSGLSSGASDGARTRDLRRDRPAL
jgi:hypothetical protein